MYVKQFLIFSWGFDHVKVETCTEGSTRHMKLINNFINLATYLIMKWFRISKSHASLLTMEIVSPAASAH